MLLFLLFAVVAALVGLRFYARAKGTTATELVKDAVARGISALARPK